MSAAASPELASYWPQVLQLASAGVPIALLLKWSNYRERSWKFSQRKTRALRKLIEKDLWRKAPALHVQYAFQDAFGRSFDRAELAFIEGRQRPLQLIKDRLAGGAFLQFKEDGSGYERRAAGPTARVTLKSWSQMSICLSWLLGVGTLFILGAAISRGQWALLFPTVDTAMLGATAAFISHALDAADRVLAPDTYRAVGPIPPKPKRARPPKELEPSGPAPQGSD